MAEYIDREKAIEAFTFADADVCQEYGDYDCEFGFSQENIRGVLESIQAADVAPVVRCGECKFFGHLIGNSGKYACGKYQLPYCKVDDFCSYGERK